MAAPILAPLLLSAGEDMAMGVAMNAGRKLVKKGVKAVRKFLHLKNGGVVPSQTFNLKPRLMRSGGRVSHKRGMTAYQKNHDSVRAILQPGEVVIPVKYFQKDKKRHINLADHVVNYLKKRKVHLPNT